MKNPVNSLCTTWENANDSINMGFGILIDLGEGYLKERAATEPQRLRAVRQEYLDEGDAIIVKRIKRYEEMQEQYKKTHNGAENINMKNRIDELYKQLADE